jgi:hypothetical protein
MAVKTMRLRWAGTCSGCDAALQARTEVSWDDEAKVATCGDCVRRADRGVAGRSAQREHERRSARELARKQAAVEKDAQWRADIVEKRPILGRVVTTLTSKPTIGPESQSTRAWKVGAVGEQLVGDLLESCTGVEVLHDRRMPRSKANIDHIAVAPSGVYVIDAKRYEGAVERRDKGTMFRPDDRLYVNGRDRTKLVVGMRGQLEAVRAALVDTGEPVPVHGVLCFVDSTWPRFFRRPLVFDGVTVLWRDALRERLEAPGTLTEPAIRDVAQVLRAALSPA